MQGTVVDCDNYLVTTVYWWANNMKMEKEKENKNLHIDNRISTFTVLYLQKSSCCFLLYQSLLKWLCQ